MYNNDLSMQMYSMRLGEYVWSKIVDEFNNETINKIDRGEDVLNENIFRQIIEFFGGSFEIFSNGCLDDFESSKNEMKNHLFRKYNVNIIKGNSYFVKMSESNEFEIGCIVFNLMDCVHELGHLFLSLDSLTVNNVVWSEETNSKSEYLVDTFGRAFVMPRERFLKVVSKYTNVNKCDIKKVANDFGVEYLQAYVRGKELLLWD